MRGSGGPARRGGSGPARLVDGDGGRWRRGAGEDLRPPGAEAADGPRVADGCRGPRQDRFTVDVYPFPIHGLNPFRTKLVRPNPNQTKLFISASNSNQTN